jgi:hypothetical protein
VFVVTPLTNGISIASRTSSSFALSIKNSIFFPPLQR